MKFVFVFTALFSVGLISSCTSAQSNKENTPQVKDPAPSQESSSENLFIDIHHLGKVKFEDVSKAHAKDLATQDKYGVRFIKFWVDEAAGNVYCLSSSPDTQSIRKTHAEAHGLLPDQIYPVSSGTESVVNSGQSFFLDVHELGAGKVSAKDVEGAHQKDLATQSKYGVNFVNYWVSEKEGRVVCLSQAPDSAAIIKTHQEAHGLLPTYVVKVKQGN